MAKKDTTAYLAVRLKLPQRYLTINFFYGAKRSIGSIRTILVARGSHIRGSTVA